jgi:hypothetical protein
MRFRVISWIVLVHSFVHWRSEVFASPSSCPKRKSVVSPPEETGIHQVPVNQPGHKADRKHY